MLKQLWEYRSFVVVTPRRFVTVVVVVVVGISFEYIFVVVKKYFSDRRELRVKPICYTGLYIPIQLRTIFRTSFISLNFCHKNGMKTQLSNYWVTTERVSLGLSRGPSKSLFCIGRLLLIFDF